MAKPLEEWSIDELRMEAVRVAEELARRAAIPATGGKKPRVDVVRASENWIRGVAWDETFTLEMVEDELALHERKAVSMALARSEQRRRHSGLAERIVG